MVVPVAGHVGGVDPQVQEAYARELPRPELRHLGAGRRADARDGVLGEAVGPHALEDAPDLPRGHAERVHLGDGADHGAVDPAPPLDRAVREVGAPAQLRYPERDRADLRLEVPLAEPVPRGPGRLAYRVRLGGHHLVDARLEQRPGEAGQPVAALVEQLLHRERVLLYSFHCGLRPLESFSWSKEILGRRPSLYRIFLTPQFATRLRVPATSIGWPEQARVLRGEKGVVAVPDRLTDATAGS